MDDCKEEGYLDIKFLLKQVYAAHISKVKELQLQVYRLTQELREAKEKRLEYCLKCKEMESAFSAVREQYKNAVLDQAKRLEELEEKLASIDRKAEKGSPRNKNKDEHEISDLPLPQNDALDSIPESLKLTYSYETRGMEKMKENNKEHTEKPLKYTEGEDAKVIAHIETSLPTHGKKLNLMLSPSESKLSCGNFDNSIVLVPETLDIVPNTLDMTGDGSSKKKSLSPKSKNAIVGKENKSNENGSSSPIKKRMSPLKSRKRAFSEEITNNESEIENEDRAFKAIKCFEKTDDLEEVPYIKLPLTSPSKSMKRKKFEKKACVEDSDFPGKKSLLVHNDKTKELAKKQRDLINDDDDFQSKCLPCEDLQPISWKSKISALKKPRGIKIKQTSSHQMTFEANVINKKANYKQTTISSSFEKNKIIVESDLLNTRKGDSPLHNEKPAEIEGNKRDESSLVGLSELASLVDADSIHTSAVSHNRETDEDIKALSHEGTSLEKDIFKDSHRKEEIVCTAMDIKPSEKKQQKDKSRGSKKQGTEFKELKNEGRCKTNEVSPEVINLFDSFDRLPVVTDEPNYKYKEETVRNKEKRKNLKGHECKYCEKYYNELGLSEKERKERTNHCSKHRAKYMPMSTPKNFWELDFPDTEECKLRGYIGDTQKVELKQRRRRPLNVE